MLQRKWRTPLILSLNNRNTEILLKSTLFCQIWLFLFSSYRNVNITYNYLRKLIRKKYKITCLFRAYRNLTCKYFFNRLQKIFDKLIKARYFTQLSIFLKKYNIFKKELFTLKIDNIPNENNQLKIWMNVIELFFQFFFINKMLIQILKWLTKWFCNGTNTLIIILILKVTIFYLKFVPYFRLLRCSLMSEKTMIIKIHLSY